MNKLLFVCLFSLMAYKCVGQTQSDLNSNAGDTFQKADNQLNQVYQRILNEYHSDTVLLRNLKVAQRIWLKLRDAEMLLKYPESDEYGSVQPMCWALYKTKLTKERTKHLKVWLIGSEEGDVCQGSVNRRENSKETSR